MRDFLSTLRFGLGCLLVCLLSNALAACGGIDVIGGSGGSSGEDLGLFAKADPSLAASRPARLAQGRAQVLKAQIPRMKRQRLVLLLRLTGLPAKPSAALRLRHASAIVPMPGETEKYHAPAGQHGSHFSHWP